MESWNSESTHFWRGRKVFITGAAGLLGGWLVKRLLELETEVVALIRDETPNAMFYRDGLDTRVTRVHGGLEDYLLIERCLNEYAIDTIFHLGAQTIVGTANRGPLSTFESNIRGTWQLLEAARRSPLVTRVVVASSDKAYGDQETLPTSEDAALRARHPYDVSKACADLIASSYHHTYGLPVCVTRCGNLFGPGDLHFDRLIPGTIRSLLRGERPVIRSDGSPVRDYLYVEDAASAYLRLAERMSEPAMPGEAFNFSLEQPLSVLELVSRIQALMDRPDLEPVIEGRVSREIQAQALSSGKAGLLLDWQPVFSLEEGLLRTIDWYHRQLR